jgi:hypothetical protein
MRNVLRHILFFVLIISCHTIFAQKNTGIIKGRIFNADQSPAYVSIELKKTKRIITSDNK